MFLCRVVLGLEGESLSVWCYNYLHLWRYGLLVAGYSVIVMGLGVVGVGFGC